MLQGPQVSKKQQEAVLGYIEKARSEGARVLVGGGVPAHLPRGYYVEPTLLVDVDPDSTIAQEEVFGPVLCVIPFDDDDDAVAIANNSIYGLSGAVSSSDTERALAVARRIRTGTLSVNGAQWFSVDTPFGGYRQSGVGRENGREGFEEYLEMSPERERPVVRSATVADLEVLASVLADAFFANPVIEWALADQSRRMHALTDYFRVVAREVYIPYGHAYVTTDGAGAALWLPPGVLTTAVPPMKELKVAWPILRGGGPGSIWRFLQLERLMGPQHPSEPHYYLHVVGAYRDRQGQGIGSALLADMLRRCDDEGALAYLECTNVVNLPLYERVGFKALDERPVPGGDVPIWFMSRLPKSSARNS